jgi:hypothetical protein
MDKRILRPTMSNGYAFPFHTFPFVADKKEKADSLTY